MIISQLIGGLGNQLFQYAFGFSKAKALNLDFRFDRNEFSHYKLRDFKLKSFEITGQEASRRELAKASSRYAANRLLTFQTKFIERIQEPAFTFSKETLEKGSGYYIGYWQCEKYFYDYRFDIAKEFRIKKDLLDNSKVILDKIRSNENSVSLHVRRGDYANNPNTLSVHGLMGIDYYMSAIEKIRARGVSPTFFVFSDEIEWVKANFNFLGENVVYVAGNTGDHDVDDFILMSACQHHVIANSTFSWWAAWLAEVNSKREKIIIAPKVWFADQSMDSSDLIPTRWMRI